MDWKEKYEALFNHIVSVKYGRPIDFPTIERKLSHLRDGDAITYEDLETIAREDLWPFKKYWMHYAIYSRAELQLLQIERGQNDTQEYMNLIQVILKRAKPLNQLFYVTLEFRQADDFFKRRRHPPGENTGESYRRPTRTR